MKSKHQHKNKDKRQKKRVPRKITARYLYNAGLHYLRRFPASTAHFQTVMKRKIQRSCTHHTDQDMNSCIAMLEETTAKLTELGMLDDDLYTKGMVRSLRRAGKSRRAIITRLSAKGVPRDMIRDYLAQYDDDGADERDNPDTCAETEAALIFARKKRIGPFARSSLSADTQDDEQTSYRKALAQMARAGFSYDICRTVLNYQFEDEA